MVGNRRISFTVQGPDSIAGFFQSVLDIYPGFQFENIKVLIDTPDQAFAEFEATAVSSKTGRSVHQLFFARLVGENGRIVVEATLVDALVNHRLQVRQ
jgi:hypothetical protein